MRMLRRSFVLLLPLAAVLLAPDAEAQGKRRGDKHDHVIEQQGHGHRHRPRKVWTSDEAVDVTRGVLRDHGYELVRIERRRDSYP